MTKKTIIAPESKKMKQTEIYPEMEKVSEPASHRRALERYDLKKQLLKPIERIVQNTDGIQLRVKFPGADEAYPDVTQAMFRFVTKLYPYALGGPLYVDEPINEREVYRAYERHKVMVKLKLRHVILEKDTTDEQLLEQLGEMI